MKRILITAALVAALSSPAYAQVYSISEVSRNFETGVVTVKGLADKQDRVTIRVAQNGTLPTSADGLFAMWDVVTDATGVFEYSFIPKGQTSGAYSVFASTTKSENVKSDFYYGDDTEVTTTVRQLNNAQNVNEIITILKNQNVSDPTQTVNHTGVLFLDNEVFDAVKGNSTVINRIAQKLYDYLNAANARAVTTDKTADEIRNKIMSDALLECYNLGEADIVRDANNNFKYDDIIKMSTLDTVNNITAYGEYYNLNNTGKSTVINKLLNKSFADYTDLYKAFTEAVCVEGLKNYNNDGYAQVDSLLRNNASYIGMNISNYTTQNTNMQNSIAAYLVRNAANINDKGNIESYIALAVQNANNNVSGGGPGGGGPSGPSGEFLGGQISKDNSTDIKSATYNDVNNSHWAYEAITSATTRGIFSGDDNGNFRPEDKIKREEFIKVLVNAFGIYDKNATCSFSDVSENAWYKAYIASAVNAGIVTGVNENYFGTGEYITREDAAVLLSRAVTYIGKALSDVKTQEFADAQSISEYALTHVNNMANAGILNGMGDGNFAPKGSCTRAQTAKMIDGIIRMLKL